MSLWRLRIPTFLGLLILVGGLVGGVYLVQKGEVWFLKAAPEEVPLKVKITNVTENSFTVSWITSGEIVGFVQYGESASLGNSARDERDELSGIITPYLTHYVKIPNLQPETKYFFKVGSGRKLFDNRGQLYELVTAPVLGASPIADTAYGTVLQSDGSPAAGAIVYLTMANSTTLSSLTQSDSQWTIPLSVGRTKDLTAYINYDQSASIEEIFVEGGNLGTSTTIANTQNDAPMPAITLGGNYDFRQLPSPTPIVSTSKFPQETQPASLVTGEEELVIISPEQSEQIYTQQPEIQGFGPALQLIKIKIESPEALTAEVMTDETGYWSFSPPTGLAPGGHTVTVTLPDGREISSYFTVLAAEGDLPAFTATGSGIIIPSVTPLPTLPATVSPTTSPLTVTPTTNPSPTATPVPRKSIPASGEEVPESGNLTPSIAFVILGIVMILTGLFFNKQPVF